LKQALSFEEKRELQFDYHSNRDLNQSWHAASACVRATTNIATTTHPFFTLLQYLNEHEPISTDAASPHIYVLWMFLIS